MGDWIRIPGSAKRYKNVKTGEEISYRQAIKRGIPAKAKSPKLPVRYPSVSPSRPYRERKKWLRGLYQLEGYYQFHREMEDEYVRVVGWSRAYKTRNYELMKEEAINYAYTQLEGSGWRFDRTIREMWFYR